MPEPFPDESKGVPCRNEPKPVVEDAVAEQPAAEVPKEPESE